MYVNDSFFCSKFWNCEKLNWDEKLKTEKERKREREIGIDFLL